MSSRSSSSLSARLLIAVSILLVVFFGVTTWVLDRVFRDASRQAINARLDVEAMALIAASEEVGPAALRPDKQLLDARYLRPNSGWYGQIWSQQGRVIWVSESLVGNQLPFDTNVKAGQRQFSERVLANGARALTLSVGLEWEFAKGRSHHLVFSVAESMEEYYQQLRSFRVNLFGGFAAMSVLLLAALALVFRRTLKPLRQIEHEIADIEAGQLQELSADYPRELMGATSNMNGLLRSERARIASYRKSLGNLAHSLKTPLAVMRTLLGNQAMPAADRHAQLDTQVSRMDEIVRYQLKRAAASAGLALGAAPIKLAEIVDPLIATLQKVYADRAMRCELNIEAECVFSGDQGDVMEVMGNLLDNAFKYGRQQIRFAASNVDVNGRRAVEFIVEDDGPGIAASQREAVLQRGIRLDERPIGQGIGLSVVQELAEVYGGSVHIDASPLGGARITVTLVGAA